VGVQQVLEGIRVVEVANFVAAPAAGALLADLGAEVIKVEVHGGELYRLGTPRRQGHDNDFPESPAFQMDNRGKRSLTLDLARPAARAALERVIDGADVVLTNLLPERRERFGLDAKTLLARKPDLVFASLTGYGSEGKDANTPSFDYAAYWARSGMMHLTRAPDADPVYMRPGVGDHAAAMSLVCGILSALRVRDRTGRGQEVDVSLLQTGLYILGNDLALTLVTRENTLQHDRREPRNPLWNQYRAADGRWLFLVMADSQRYWPHLCRALGRDDLLHDERFTKAGRRLRNARALVDILDREFLAHALDEWSEILAKHKVIWAPVLEPGEAVADPQARAMGYFESVDHPTAGRFETVGPPFKLSGQPLRGDRPAPAVGADSEALLAAAGLTQDEIREALRPSGEDA
jgi:crotonobetainyl-CoA:carnitine CoA-transferase CaiB-like acyl-CoA transferase